MKILLFLKSAANQLGLFATPVQVQGTVRKDGTVVKQHTAIRRKRLDEIKSPARGAHGMDDLFAAPAKTPEPIVPPAAEILAPLPRPLAAAPASQAEPPKRVVIIAKPEVRQRSAQSMREQDKAKEDLESGMIDEAEYNELAEEHGFDVLAAPKEKPMMAAADNRAEIASKYAQDGWETNQVKLRSFATALGIKWADGEPKSNEWLRDQINSAMAGIEGFAAKPASTMTAAESVDKTPETQGNQVDEKPDLQGSDAEPWQMTIKEYHRFDQRKKFDAIQQALGGGKTLYARTSSRTTPLSKPEHVQIDEGGSIRAMRGGTSGKYDYLVIGQVDDLASQAGMKVPSPLQNDAHEKSVEAALEAGQDVPDKVRADFPDIHGPFGVPAGVTKRERIRMNGAARTLLESLGDRKPTQAEKLVLSKYSGQGGAGDSLNEFYTDPEVATAMWTILQRFGVQGDVLEPSCGTGVFMHTAPFGMRVIGVELDETSAGIAKALHDKHEVTHASLERFATSDVRQFDAVIGNVPFGLRGGLIKDDKPDMSTAETYFLDAAMDKTKAGGIVALIVPTGIMDGKNNRAFRKRMLRKGEFLGAHRLPNTAFEHAHTEVTTDVVVFRKRPQDVAGALMTVTQDQMMELGIWNSDFIAGKYFQSEVGSKQVYGTPEAGWRSKAGMGNDFTVAGSMEGVPEQLSRWGGDMSSEGWGKVQPDVPAILEVLNGDDKGTKQALSGALKKPYEHAVLGDTKVIDGVTYVLQGEPPRWHRVGGDEAQKPAAITDAEDMAGDLEWLFNDFGSDTEKAEIRARLQKKLPDYIKKHGIPSKNKDLVRAAGGDKSLYRLIGAIKADGSFSDMVAGKPVAGFNDADFDKVAARMALEQNGFTADQLAQSWTGGDREAALDHLFASRSYAIDADGRTWSSLDNYLTGELYGKLDAAKAAVKNEAITPHYRDKFSAQIEALEAAIDPRSLEDVECMLNSAFIPLPAIAEFFNARNRAGNTYQQQSADLEIFFNEGMYTHKGGAYETRMLMKYLNRTGVKKDDLPTIAEWNKEFKTWLTGSEFRDNVEDVYNRAFRGYKQKDYSDAPIQIDGLNPEFDVNAYHYSGLRWALDAGKGIVADDVGLGKTGRGLMLAKLAKQHGRAKKPTLVAPKTVLANWVKEIDAWFPGSKVLVIGETYTKDKSGNLKSKADDKTTRDRKYHELSQNEYDFVLISQPAFNDLDMDPETKEKYLSEDFWEQRGASLVNAKAKKKKKAMESFDQAAAKREFVSRTDAIHFNDLGIDMLIVDEAAAYKNLYAAKQRQGQSPKFLGGQGLSNRAMDMNFKARWVREQNGGKNVYGLTATYTKNSPLEVYSMLSHIAPEAFEQIGIRNSEEFLDRFCQFESQSVLTIDGKIEEALVTVGFKNLDELRPIMKRYINRRTAAEVGLVIPKPDEQNHLVDMTDEQQEVYEDLREQAQNYEKGDTGEGHIFSIMSRMGKAAMDLELLDASEHRGARSPKFEAATKHIMSGAKEGGQVVFIDNNDCHEKMAKILVKAEMKREEIGIINADVASSSAQRQNISDGFNAGKLKVVIGNTATMGEGINLQKTAADTHHLDLPWDPGSLHQRNGRTMRQGNKRDKVRIHTYLAKGSFDGYRYQSMNAKRDWMDLLWNGGDRVDNLAREGALSRDEMRIMLSADPDAERAKYEGNKAAAMERQRVEGRKEASDEFARLQGMKQSFRNMRAGSTPAAIRLEANIEKITNGLRANKFFLTKEALDKSGPVLIHPETGEMWAADTAFEIADDTTTLPLSARLSKTWVVDRVLPGNNKVTVRMYGKPGGRQYDVDLADLNDCVNQVPFDSEVEDDLFSGSVAARGGVDTNSLSRVKDLLRLPEARIRKLAPAIQKHLSYMASSYYDSNGDAVAMLDRGGKPEVFEKTRFRKELDAHEFMLPLPENKAKAIAGWVEHETRRNFSTSYPDTKSRSYSWNTPTPNGVKVEYPGNPSNISANMWTSAGTELFGGSFEREARADFTKQRLMAGSLTETFHDALAELGPTLAVSDYGTKVTWPEATIATLWSKASERKVLEQNLGEATRDQYGPPALNHEAFKYENGSHMHHSTIMGETVHNGLIRLAINNGHRGLAGLMTVRYGAVAKQPPEHTLQKLMGFMVKHTSPGTAANYNQASTIYSHDPAVLEVMAQHVKGNGMEDLTVGNIPGFPRDGDPIMKEKNKSKKVIDVIERMQRGPQ